jgi:hypothetical protein
MNEPLPSIVSILDDLRIDARQISAVTIGLPETDTPDFGTVDAYETLSGPGDLPRPLRAQLGIVVTPLEYMPRSKAEQLLSRLRDVHCEKVLLLDTESGWSPDILRSLGYLEVKRPSARGRCYMFDPDIFNQPREWNNSTDWANPENFRRYRW